MEYSQNSRTQRSGSATVRRIGLLNHMGGGNLGDDATQDAVIQNIKSRWPNAEIVLFSMNPADTRPRHGVPSYPIRTETWGRNERHFNGSSAVNTGVKKLLRKCRPIFQLLRTIKTVATRISSRFFDEPLFLGKSFVILRSFDLFIISGGGQLLDSWGGPWKFPYTVFKWTLLAKLSRAKCYFLNVGAGPLKTPLARWFVKSALRHADYVSFRDENSRALVRRIGFNGKGEVSADCVYALDAPAHCARERAPQDESIVGLAPMAYCDPRVYWQRDQAVYEGFIQKLASFGLWLNENRYLLALFSTDIFFDSQTIEDLKAALAAGQGNLWTCRVKHEPIAAVDGLLTQMQSMDYIVTCRFHGVVFAHLLNKPVLALSHHPKVSTLMNDLGLAKYCMDIHNCDVNQLRETFLSLVANKMEVRDRMADKATYYKRTLLAQFDQLFPQRMSL